eukprot:4392958-Pleurochrysis_carterae.AAC.1
MPSRRSGAVSDATISATRQSRKVHEGSTQPYNSSVATGTAGGEPIDRRSSGGAPRWSPVPPSTASRAKGPCRPECSSVDLRMRPSAVISRAAVRSVLLAGDELLRAAHLAVGADEDVRNATLIGSAGEASRDARGTWR